MPSNKLIFPEPAIFKTSIKLGIHNINYGGHLGNEQVLSLMHEARMRWLVSLGYQSEIGLMNNIGIIITESLIQYKAEAFYGDELVISISLLDITNVGLQVYYRLDNITNGNVTAIGRTQILFFDYALRKIARMPGDFKIKLTNG